MSGSNKINFANLFFILNSVSFGSCNDILTVIQLLQLAIGANLSAYINQTTAPSKRDDI